MQTKNINTQRVGYINTGSANLDPTQGELRQQVEAAIRAVVASVSGAANVPQQALQISLEKSHEYQTYSFKVEAQDAAGAYTLHGKVALKGGETPQQIEDAVHFGTTNGWRFLANDAKDAGVWLTDGPVTGVDLTTRLPQSKKKQDTFYVTLGSSQRQEGAFPNIDVPFERIVDVNRGRPDATKAESVTYLDEQGKEVTRKVDSLAAHFLGKGAGQGNRTNLGGWPQKATSLLDLQMEIYNSINKRPDQSTMGKAHKNALQNWPMELSFFKWVSAEGPSWDDAEKKPRNGFEAFYGRQIPFAKPDPYGFISPAEVVQINGAAPQATDRAQDHAPHTMTVRDGTDRVAAHEGDRKIVFAMFVDKGGAMKQVEVPADMVINQANMAAQLAVLKAMP